MLNIYFGRENVDKEKFIFDRIKDLNFGRKAFILVPDQFTLDTEKALFEYLGVSCLMDIEVISMSRLGLRLLKEQGGEKRAFIDKYGRHMILSEIARRHKNELKIYRGLEEKSSFIDFVNNFISELKQYNCGTEELLSMSKSIDSDSFVRGKLEDLYLLYSGYEKKIEGKYTDSEDYIDLFLSKIKTSTLVRDSEIWVYGFDSFSPKNMLVLGELMTASKSLNMVLTYDDNKKARDGQLWTLSEIIIERLKEIADQRGVQYLASRINENENRVKRPSAVSVLEQELYSVPFKKVGFSEGIKLVGCANFYNEAESAAAFVLKLLREEKYRLRDIRIICNDQEVRGPILVRTFREYGLELFSDSNRDIFDSQISQAIRLLLDISGMGYRTTDVLGYLKLGLSDLTMDEASDLENYAIKYHIKGRMWKKPFIKGETEYGLEELGRLNSLREKATVPFEILEDIIRESNTVSEFIDSFYDYLYNTIDIQEKILTLMKAQEDIGRNDMSAETAQVYGKIIDILDQIREISGTEKFDVSDFSETFAIGLKQVEIGVLPPAKDGLLMGTMQRTRTGKIKALVVVGANEGILPKEKLSQGLFTGDEKDLFKEKGIELLKVDSIMLLEERMGIYRNLSKPENILYLSYCVCDTEGKETKESSIFSKVRQVFPNLKVEKDILNQEATLDILNSRTAGLRHLTESLSAVTFGRNLKPEWSEALDWFKKRIPEEVNSLKKSISFTNRQEELGRKAANALFRKETDTALSLSPSRVEVFSRCPFSHLISYGLKADERRTFEVAQRELGDVYHACLKKLTESLNSTDNEGKPMELSDPESQWMKISYEEMCRRIEGFVEEETANYKEALFKLGNAETYRTKRLKDVLFKASWNLIGQVRSGSVLRASFETGFGRNKQIKPIEIELEDKKIYIEGIIDRVDYLKDDRVKIVDYKTGEEKFDIQEVEEGYRLQLMLYLKAAREEGKKPAGVFYFHVHEPMKDMSGKDEEKLSDEIERDYRLSGLMVNDPIAVSGILGNFTGYSKIASVKKDKEGNLSGQALMEENDFNELEEKVNSKVRKICDDLISGKIDIAPMKSKDNNPCTYCKYKGICRFDTLFSGCKWRTI